MLDDACESGIEADAPEQATTFAFDCAVRGRTVFSPHVSDLVIAIGLFAAGEFLELFEFVEIKFRLV